MSEPQWRINKRKRNSEYEKEHSTTIAIHLRTDRDAELIEIYRSIPDKTDWFRDCLRKYKEEAS